MKMCIADLTKSAAELAKELGITVSEAAAIQRHLPKGTRRRVDEAAAHK